MENNPSVDEILSQRPEAADDTASRPEGSEGVSRDERGRFASKAEKPEIAPEAPIETGVKPEVVAPPAAPQQPPQGYVPLTALVDQRLEARQAKERLRELERELSQLKQPKPEPVDFYADPDAAFKQRFQSEFQSVLGPIQQQLQESRTALFEERLHRIAGSEKAGQIEAELQKAMEAGDPEIHILGNALQTQGVAAVKALVDWYDKRTFDPAAKEAEIEARVLAKYGIKPGETGAAAKPAPIMPSNLAGARNVGSREGPAWSGPPAIADIFKK